MLLQKYSTDDFSDLILKSRNLWCILFDSTITFNKKTIDCMIKAKSFAKSFWTFFFNEGRKIYKIIPISDNKTSYKSSLFFKLMGVCIFSVETVKKISERGRKGLEEDFTFCYLTSYIFLILIRF